MEIDDPAPASRLQTTDRQGKTIKQTRYMKTLYGVTANYTVTCACGETVASGTLEDETPASSMEELV